MAWLAVAAVCVVGNAGLDIVAGPTFHRRQYAVAEPLATIKVDLCWVGRVLFVPGQRRELERAVALRDDIRSERAQFRPE